MITPAENIGLATKPLDRNVEQKNGQCQFAISVSICVEHTSESALMRPGDHAFEICMGLNDGLDSFQNR